MSDISEAIAKRRAELAAPGGGGIAEQIARRRSELSAPVTATPDGRPVIPGTTKEQAERIPEGMVYDPRTGGYFDAASAAARGSPAGKYARGLLGSVASGTLFAGEYVDEAAGAATGLFTDATPEMGTEYARQIRKQFADEHPTADLLGRVGGGILSGAALARGIAVLAPKFSGWLSSIMPASLSGRTVAAIPAGATAGGIEGTVAGYGAGTTPETRKATAQEYGTYGALGGGVAGPLGVLAGAGVTKLMEPIAARLNAVRARVAGMSPEATALVRSAVSQDDATGQIHRNINRAGAGAMPADAGPATADLLDTAVSMSQSGAALGGSRVADRASAAGRALEETFDQTMGGAVAVRRLGEIIDDATKPGINQAYRSAYATAIDYSTRQGRAVERIYGQIPNRIKAPALQLAHEMMVLDEIPPQWLINVGDDGVATATRVPGVAELDYVKRALDAIVEDGTDELTGKVSSEARVAGEWARRLRSAVTDAVPDYGAARNLASDAFSLHRATALGGRLLKPGTTRDEIARWTREASDLDRRAAIAGLRADIDERLANVRLTLGNPDPDVAKVKQALRDMRSPAARHKILTLLGPQHARNVFRAIDSAAAASELSSNVARNSRTAPRTKRDALIQAARDYSPGQVGRDVMSGQVVGAGQKVARLAAGNTPMDQAARDEALYLEIAEYLTGKRGRDALTAANEMVTQAQANPAAAAMLKDWQRSLTESFGNAAYQIGPRQQQTGPR